MMKPKINPGLPCSNLNLKLPIDPATQNVHRHLLNHELSNDPPTQTCPDIFWVLDIKIPTAPESDPQVHRKVSAIADMLHTFCCAKCGLGSFGCDGIKNGYTKQAEKSLMRNGLLQQHFFFFFLRNTYLVKERYEKLGIMILLLMLLLPLVVFFFLQTCFGFHVLQQLPPRDLIVPVAPLRQEDGRLQTRHAIESVQAELHISRSGMKLLQSGKTPQGDAHGEKRGTNLQVSHEQRHGLCGESRKPRNQRHRRLAPHPVQRWCFRRFRDPLVTLRDDDGLLARRAADGCWNDAVALHNSHGGVVKIICDAVQLLVLMIVVVVVVVVLMRGSALLMMHDKI